MMKTINLISIRWVLVMACALIGSVALFTACEQQSMEELTPMETTQPTGKELPVITEFDFPDENSLESRASYQLVSHQPNKWYNGWNLLIDGNMSNLKGKDIKVEIVPTKNTSFNSYAMPSWTPIQTGAAAANVKTTREVLKSQLTGSNDHAKFYIYASGWTGYDIKVYVRDSGGNPPPTGSGFNCSHNPLAFPGSFTIGIEGAQPVHTENGSNNMTITTQVEGKNRYQHINESGANFVRLNFFRPNNFSQTDYSWLNTYDDIVCEFASRGIPIYGLVTDVVGGDHPFEGYFNEPNSQKEQWIDKYVDAFEVIVKRYKGYINIYESFNEPNAWVAGTPRMDEARFAYLLQETYGRIKPSGTNPHNVKLITGPLEAHDGYQQQPQDDFAGAGIYFQNVLNNLNGFPFDGIGYHIYARKYDGGQYDLEGTIHNVLQSVWNVTNSVPWNQRQLYISEIGWNAESMGNRIQGSINDKEEAHANFITRGLEKLKQNSWRIKAVSFFSIESFNNGEGGHAFLAEDFGLIRPFDIKEQNVLLLSAGKKQKCWCVFQKMARDGQGAATARSQCGVGSY